MIKKGFLLLLPVLTLFSPILFFNAPGWWSQLKASIASASAPPAAAPPQGTKPKPDPFATRPLGQEASLDGASVHELTEVLRFDISPAWVVRQWPRVSSGLAQLQLQGYRVPLVTGTDQDDLAGSLTYYFNPRQQVQRLTFHGTTGDTRSLVALFTARFGFRRRLTNEPGVFLYETLGSNGKPISFLWIRPAPVVKATEPLERYEVAILMERPEST